MVLDGCNDPKMSFENPELPNPHDNGSDGIKRGEVSDYLPKSRRGLILVTTTSYSVACSLVKKKDQAVEVRPLTKEEGFSLLRKRIPAENCDDQCSYRLVETLKRSPLAIRQLGTYLSARGTLDANALLQSIQQPSEHLSNRTGKDEMSNYQMWQTFFEYIYEASDTTATTLLVLSMFPFQSFPRSLLDFLPDKEHVESSLALLLDFAMITISPEHVCLSVMIRLKAQYWLRQQGKSDGIPNLATNEQATIVADRALHLLSEGFPRVKYARPECDELYPYAQAALAFSENIEPSKFDRATLQFKLGSYEFHLKRFDLAHKLLDDYLQVCKNREDAPVKEARMMLQAIQRKGRAKESVEPAAPEQPQKGETRSGSLAKGAIKAQKNLTHALLLADQKLYPEAEELWRKTLENWEVELGEEHRETLALVDRLAAKMLEHGQYSQAVILFTTLRSWCKKYKPDEPDTPRQEFNIASAYDHLGKYKEAEQWYLRALKSAKKRASKKDDPVMLQRLCNLANFYHIQGQDAKAEKISKEALARETEWQKPCPSEKIMLNIKHNYAIFMQDRHEMDRAKELFQEVLERQVQCLGALHPDTLRTASNTIHNCHLRGDHDAGMEGYEAILKYQAELGETNPDTLCTRHRFAEFLEEQGRVDEARLHYKQALKGREKVLGRNHRDTRCTRERLEKLNPPK